MTSSARSRIDGGTARPSAVAVLRFGPSRILSETARKIARLLAAQNAIDKGGGATPDVYKVRSVGEQAARGIISKAAIEAMRSVMREPWPPRRECRVGEVTEAAKPA